MTSAPQKWIWQDNNVPRWHNERKSKTKDAAEKFARKYAGCPVRVLPEGTPPGEAP